MLHILDWLSIFSHPSHINTLRAIQVVLRELALSLPPNMLYNHGLMHPPGFPVCMIPLQVRVTDRVFFISNLAEAGSGGAIVVANNVSLLLSGNVTFRNNTTPVANGGALAAADNTRVAISNGVLFVDNTAGPTGFPGGGGIAAFDQAQVNISDDVEFRGNKAAGCGGAVSLTNGEAAVRVTRGVHFIDNFADDCGGALYANPGFITLEDALLRGNSAGKGGAVIGQDNASITIGNNNTFLNNLAKSAGGADVRADSKVKLVMSNGTDLNISSPSVLWFRKECELGEQIRGGYCQPCPALTYGLDPDHKDCSGCPSNAKCPGGTQIIPDTGFWHSGRYSAQIHRCPNRGICGYNGSCAEGYEGNVCGACMEAWGSKGQLRCGKCMTAAKTLGLYLLAAAVVLIILSYVVHTTLKDNTHGISGVRPSDFIKILLRHVQFLAIISSIGLDWPRSLAGIFAAAAWVFTASSPEVVSLDCLFRASSSAATGSTPVAIKRVLVYILAPLALFFCVLLTRVLLWGVCKLFQLCDVTRRGARASASSVLSVCFLVVLFFFYPFLTRVALGFFACLALDNVEKGPTATDPYPQYAVANASGGYWVSDIQQPCWEGWHKAWALGLGVPLAAIFCLGVPLAVLLLLTLNRTKMDQHSTFSECFGFLYHNYRPKRFYWEVVSIVQLAVVVAISVFTHTLGPYFSALLLQLAFFIICGLQHIFKPYSSKLLNDTALLSAAVLFFTSSITLSLFRVDLEAPEVYGDVMGVIGLLFNAGVVLWCCYLVIVHGSGAVAKVLRQLQQQLLHLQQCIQRKGGDGDKETGGEAATPLATNGDAAV